MKAQSILRGLVGTMMIVGFLAQMWDLFDQFLSDLKTVAVSFEEKYAVEFPSLAFCDSRGFRTKTNLTSNATQYNATTFNLEEEVSLNLLRNNVSEVEEVPTNTYTTELLPTAYNGYCKLYEFKRQFPVETQLCKSKIT